MRERDRRVFEALRARRLPVALSMAGGYGRDLQTTVDVQLNTMREAAASWQLWQPKTQSSP